MKKRTTHTVRPLDPHEDERDSRITREANEAFEAEKFKAPTEPVTEKAGVPMAEALDPARVAEYCEREPWILTPVKHASFTAKFGTIPARFEYIARCLEEEGRDAEAAPYHEAAKTGSRLYWEQLKKDFRILQSQMSRSEIGAFAQQLWVNVTRRVEHEGASLAGLVSSERLAAMDDGLQDLVRDSIFANTKWLCLNINEMPVKGATGPRPRLH